MPVAPNAITQGGERPKAEGDIVMEHRSGHLSIIPATAVFDRRLGNADLRVLSALGTYADREGRCRPAITTLAKRLGISDRRVRTCIRKLEECGHIEIHHQPGRPNHYNIINRDLDPGSLRSGESGTPGSGVEQNPGTSASGVSGTSGSGVKADPGTSCSGGAEREVQGTPEREVPPNDIKNVKENDYAFAGAVIRLNWRDFAQWSESYKAVTDLRAWLQSRDDWLQTLPDDDRRRSPGGWFSTTSRALGNEAEKRLAAQRTSTSVDTYDPGAIH